VGIWKNQDNIRDPVLAELARQLLDVVLKYRALNTSKQFRSGFNKFYLLTILM